MNTGPDVLVVMETVHQSLKMEDCLEKAGISFRVVAKPRNLGPDCGVALKVALDMVPDVQRLADSIHCGIKGVFQKREEEWIKYNP